MRQEFAVVPPNVALAWVVPGLALALAFCAMLYAARPAPQLLWLSVPVLIAATAVAAVGLRMRRVMLDGDKLVIAAGLANAKIDVAALDLDAARIVNLDEHAELRPGRKFTGVSVPGLKAGHFRRVGGIRSFVLITNRSRVLLLPERSGRRLMLSLERPQALLDALRATGR